MNKQVGLLLNMEEYAKTSGGTAWKPVISSVFDKDGFVATEILNKSTAATTLAKMESALRDKPLKAGSAPVADAGQQHNGFHDEFSDNIPF